MPEPKCILLIDEDADHLAILATLLRHHGYGVVTAPSPAMGIGAARQRRPAAILLGLHFGGEPAGLAQIDALRSDPATGHIPIVVVSSFTDVHLDALEKRQVPHVAKGGDVKRVLAALDVVLTPPPTEH